MARFAKLAPPVGSAMLLLAAFPPFNLGFLVFVALAPWIASLHGKTSREGFWSGYVFGIVYMGGQFVWLFQFVSRWTGSPGMGLIPAVLCTVAGALYFGLAGWTIAIALRRGWHGAVPLAWAGVEVFRTFIPGLAFPWGLLHTPLWPYPATIQLAYFGTAFLVSATLALANSTLARWLAGAKLADLRTPIVLMLTLGVLSWARYTTPYEGRARQVALGQTGVDMAFGDPADEPSRIAAAVGEILQRLPAGETDLLILPEGTADDGGAWPPRVGIPLPSEFPVVLGGQRSTGEAAFQSAFAYDGEWSHADKRRLVIFGEYVPFRSQLPFLAGFDLPSGDLVPADRTSSVRVDDMMVGPMLCFEGLFPDVARDQALNGAQMLAIMSIDDWYLETNAPEQLMAGAVFRAVETGLPVGRAASRGLSMAADPRGNVVAMAPPGKRAALRAELVLPERPDYLPISWGFVWIAFLALPAVPIADQWLLRRAPKASAPE